jgi:tartrate dehydratase beta subunit/fumarate hydratase class I family protein
MNRHRRGKKTKEEVVRAYIAALENKSEGSILSLIPETHSAGKDIHAKIQKFGGHSFQNVKVDYLSEFGPLMAKITIQGSYPTTENKMKEFTDKIYVQKIRTRWYLILGKMKQGIPESFPKTKL